MKKIFGMTIVASLITFLFVGMVNASSYWSTLSIGQGRTVTGATRTYSPGINAISIKPYTFDKVNGLNYTKLEVALYNDNNSANPIVGTTIFKIEKEYLTLRHYFKNELPGGNRYYKFSTKVDDFNYGGVTSEEVLMMSFVPSN